MDKHRLDLKEVVLEVPNQDLSSSEKHARLISDLDAEFESGKLYAFMGASGSSKTTTMEAIAGVIPYGSLTSGEILIDDKERSDGKWERESTYGRQAGYSIDELTVNEFIYYSTSFSLPNESKENIKKAMDEVLSNILGLDHVRNNRMEKLSGGEKKRVGIATSFMKMLLLEGKLKAVLLDEPTSELDSGLAVKVVRFLKDYARRSGSIVILTVHQPGPELYSTFDDLLFMHKGSKIYAGPANDFMKYLNSKGIYNTNGSGTDTEFLFSLFTDGTREAEQYKEEVKQIKMEAKKEEGIEEKLKDSDDTGLDFVPNFSAAFSLVKRQLIIDCFRSRGLLQILFICLVETIYASVMCHTQGNGNLSGYGLILGLFALYITPTENGILDKGRTYTKEEVDRGLYSTATLWFSSVMLEIFLSIIKMVILFGICYGLKCALGFPEPMEGMFSLYSFIYGTLIMLSSGITCGIVKIIASPETTIGKILLPLAMIYLALTAALSVGSSFPSLLTEVINSIQSQTMKNGILWVLDSRLFSYFTFLIKMLTPGSITSSELTKYLIDEHSNSDYFLSAGMVIISYLLLSSIAIIIMDRSFTPSRRLELSEGKDAGSKKRSFTRGSWIKRFLITLAAVLIISTLIFILYRSIISTSSGPSRSRSSSTSSEY